MTRRTDLRVFRSIALIVVLDALVAGAALWGWWR